MGEIPLEGCGLTPLRIISNPKGDVFHALKVSENSFKQFGEAYFSTVLKNDIKGWKKHKEMILNLVVIQGEVKFVLYDDRPTSSTRNQIFETTLSLKNYQRLTVPPGIWMAFQGLSDSVNLLLNIASIEHDPVEAITRDLKEVPYVW